MNKYVLINKNPWSVYRRRAEGRWEGDRALASDRLGNKIPPMASTKWLQIASWWAGQNSGELPGNKKGSRYCMVAYVIQERSVFRFRVEWLSLLGYEALRTKADYNRGYTKGQRSQGWYNKETNITEKHIAHPQTTCLFSFYTTWTIKWKISSPCGLFLRSTASW